MVDCGPLGYGALAGHGHADALSITLRAAGRDILVDPGTYDYFSFPEWREYFRSTRAHNTVLVDGQDQSEMLGSFLWGRRAHARCLEWLPSDTGGKITGEHDGYRVLPDPVTHRRTVELRGDEGLLVITDDVICRDRHEVQVRFHFGEGCVVEQTDGNVFRIDAGAEVLEMTLDPRLEARGIAGSEESFEGWVSRGYHRKTTTTTVVGTAQIKADTSLRCQLRLGDLEIH